MHGQQSGVSVRLSGVDVAGPDTPEFFEKSAEVATRILDELKLAYSHAAVRANGHETALSTHQVMAMGDIAMCENDSDDFFQVTMRDMERPETLGLSDGEFRGLGFHFEKAERRYNMPPFDDMPTPVLLGDRSMDGTPSIAFSGVVMSHYPDEPPRDSGTSTSRDVVDRMILLDHLNPKSFVFN